MENESKKSGDWFHRILAFLSLSDHAKNLSLTNLILVALAVRLIADPRWTIVVGLGAALLNYAHKRYEYAQAAAREAKVTETAALSKKVDELARLQSDVNTQAAETKKQHEEMKKILSSSVLVNAFKPPVRRSQVSQNVAG